MSLIELAGDVVHYPKRRDVFQFDDEVAKIFDNMAPRSIPMYNEVHRLHVSMFEHVFRTGAVVVDVGSSTGHLFKSIEEQRKLTLPALGVHPVAIDISEPMMDQLRQRYPYVQTIVGGLPDLPDLEEKADIMFCLYTLQFIHPEKKVAALDWLVRNLRLGGVLVLGQKEIIDNVSLRDLLDDEYYQFRRDNGYTQTEIDAKTAALRGSMWPIPHDQLTYMLRANNLDFVETTRWLQFSTLACVRRR